MLKKMLKNAENFFDFFLLFKIFYVNFQNFSLIFINFQFTIAGHQVNQVYSRQITPKVEIIHD